MAREHGRPSIGAGMARPSRLPPQGSSAKDAELVNHRIPAHARRRLLRKSPDTDSFPRIKQLGGADFDRMDRAGETKIGLWIDAAIPRNDCVDRETDQEGTTKAITPMNTAWT